MTDPLKTMRRSLVNLMRGVFLGDKPACRKGRKGFKKQFPEAAREELEKAKADTPPKERWWAAVSRPPGKGESRKQCGQCRTLLGGDAAKDCPGCGVVLHAACYDDSAGGYKTPGCRACRHRTCFR